MDSHPPFAAPGQYPPEALEAIEVAELSRQESERLEAEAEKLKYALARGDQWKPYRKPTP